MLYVATARRAGIACSGVGLPGHYFVGDLGRTIEAAKLRLALPLDPQLAETLRSELRSLRARLN